MAFDPHPPSPCARLVRTFPSDRALPHRLEISALAPPVPKQGGSSPSSLSLVASLVVAHLGIEALERRLWALGLTRASSSLATAPASRTSLTGLAGRVARSGGDGPVPRGLARWTQGGGGGDERGGAGRGAETGREVRRSRAGGVDDDFDFHRALWRLVGGGDGKVTVDGRVMGRAGAGSGKGTRGIVRDRSEFASGGPGSVRGRGVESAAGARATRTNECAANSSPRTTRRRTVASGSGLGWP